MVGSLRKGLWYVYEYTHQTNVTPRLGEHRCEMPAGNVYPTDPSVTFLSFNFRDEMLARITQLQGTLGQQPLRKTNQTKNTAVVPLPSGYVKPEQERASAEHVENVGGRYATAARRDVLALQPP